MLLSFLVMFALQSQPQTPPSSAPQPAPAALTAASPELRISYDEFRKLYDSGNVLVIDTRGGVMYRVGHIPGAISIPFDQVESRIPELKKETRPIVAYCS